MMCLFAMTAASLSAKAQEITIILFPGWNWISYPNAEMLDVNTALGDFVPVNGDIIQSQFSSSTYVNGYWRGGVTHFMPGWGYMYFSKREDIVSFVFVDPTPQPQILVTTSEPMLITAISAMGGGEVTTDEGVFILAKGLCWATHENPTTNEDYFLDAGSGVGSFTGSMTDLNISSTYYVRAYAVTADGTFYGEQRTFTTRDGIPILTTSDVTDITGESAICGGNISDNGGLNVTAKGVCWSTSPNPTTSNNHTTNGTDIGSFTSSITGLDVSTAYYVRAYATTSAGTGYGEERTFITRNGIPTLTTTEVTSVGSGWGYSGGNITDDGGLALMARGVCWSVLQNPTLADSHSTDGNGTGSFTSYISGLSMNTTYYVRAYATNNIVTIYGNQLSFTTLDDYVYVDLGLPSGLLWATCNVGADTPEDYGDYFAWGETQPKSNYNWSTYQYCNGSGGTLTKYCTNSNYGYNGFTDNLTTLLPEDDAATAIWGSDWRMPTKEEFQELYNNTTETWVTQNGVNGRLFTASNGNSLFLPATGYRYDSSPSSLGTHGYYWSSSLGTGGPLYARYFGISSNNCGMGNYGRYFGLSVRPVRSSGQNNAPTGAIDGKFTINGNGDQVYFSQGNLQYQASTDTWRFAECQWDYVGTQTPGYYGDVGGTVDGSDNGCISSTYNGWIDLFGWGTSNWNNGNIYYHPWDYEYEDLLLGSGYGPTDGTSYSYDLTGSYANADWGVYNPIINGGNIVAAWRTLTNGEWDFILNTRNTVSGYRYVRAQVNNIKGVILLPDDWNTNIYSLNNPNTYNSSFSSNEISTSQWTILENAGAIFLPAAGARDVTTVGVDSYGGYWSSSCNDVYAYFLVFYDGQLSLYPHGLRFMGRSVRLVCNVE